MPMKKNEVNEKETLPKGWSEIYLSEISSIINSGFPSGKHNKNKIGIPHLRPMNIDYNGYIDLTEIKYVQVKKYDSLLKGDILFNNTNSPDLIGKTSYVKEDTNWAYSNHMTRIRVNTKSIIPKYIAYFLHNLFLQDFFKLNCSHHVNQASVNTKFLQEKIIIPLSPLNEQNRIVSKIDDLFREVDSGILHLNKCKILLKQFRQSILKYAFEGKLTAKWREKNIDEIESPKLQLKRLLKSHSGNNLQDEEIFFENHDINNIPSSWILTRLQVIAKLNPKSDANISNNTEVSFLPMRCVHEETGYVDLSLSKMLKEVRKGYTSFIENDIIFAKITPCMENGKIAIVNNLRNGIGFGSTEFHVIRLINELPRKYYFYYLLQENLREDAKIHMKGNAGQLRVSSMYMQDILIPFPSLNEQYVIIDEIEKSFSVINDIESNVEICLLQKQFLRNSILKNAFEGKLVAQDPHDEPASILLEKIKQEKSLIEIKKNSKRITENRNFKQMKLL